MATVCWIMLVFLCQTGSVSASAEGQKISAVIGEDVILPCEAKQYLPFELVEWSKAGPITQYLLVFRDYDSRVEIPQQRYKSRVKLKDLQNGDVSLILKNLKAEDRGLYECYVVGKPNRKKRDIQPISKIYLDVLPPSPGNNHRNNDDEANTDGKDTPLNSQKEMMVVVALTVVFGITPFILSLIVGFRAVYCC
ncbi:butyrophilin-like protein 1 [Cyprinodon tularosa]|uniref:butyrophilin-like protein 1 n=1 Tax=Cyprinodon tularosa TaxID=77115 RepID=UPI0018E226A3|nr:butyrophilin-like protein 1 [Cyprinodon tularosa]